MAFAALRRFGAVGVLCALVAVPALADTFQITGTVDDALFEGNDVTGTVQITYEATGLPNPDPNNITATLKVLSSTLSLSNGRLLNSTGGSGELEQDLVDDSVYRLVFDTDSLSALFYVPLSFNGVGPIGYDVFDPPTIDSDYYFVGSSAAVATPEPESLTLLLSGLSASGLAWGAARRRLAR